MANIEITLLIEYLRTKNQTSKSFFLSFLYFAAFRLDIGEWSTMFKKADKIIAAIEKLKCSDSGDSEHFIKQYKWVMVKLDGSDEEMEGERWYYIKAQAEEEGNEKRMNGWSLHLQWQLVPKPDPITLRNVAHAFLLKRATEANGYSQYYRERTEYSQVSYPLMVFACQWKLMP